MRDARETHLVSTPCRDHNHLPGVLVERKRDNAARPKGCKMLIIKVDVLSMDGIAFTLACKSELAIVFYVRKGDPFTLGLLPNYP